MFEFGARDWGPQPLQALLSSVDCNGISLGVAADTGVKDVRDLKGKRIGVLVSGGNVDLGRYCSLLSPPA